MVTKNYCYLGNLLWSWPAKWPFEPQSDAALVPKVSEPHSYHDANSRLPIIASNRGQRARPHGHEHCSLGTIPLLSWQRKRSCPQPQLYPPFPPIPTPESVRAGLGYETIRVMGVRRRLMPSSYIWFRHPPKCSAARFEAYLGRTGSV